MKDTRKYHKRAEKRFRLMGTMVLVLSLFILFLGLGSSHAQAQREKQERCYQSVMVSAGDTLWDLALQYAPEYTDVRQFAEELRQINRILREDLLQPGQYLVIPYYQ